MIERRTVRPAYLAVSTMLVLAVGCGEAEPVLLPASAVAIESEITVPESPDSVLEIQPTVAGSADTAGLVDTAASTGLADTARSSDSAASAGEVAGAQAATNPPLTSSSIAAPAPPLTLTGADPTTPTTRPEVSSTTAVQTTTTVVQAAPSTTPTDPSTGTAAPAGVVEFRIRSGTQAGPWNSFDSPVRVTVGQTLRIYNDDVVAHTVHSNGAPFAHGPTIQPGGFADHPIVDPLTPDIGAPANYEHDAGVSAPFWVQASPRGATPTVPEQSTTAPPPTAPSPDQNASGGSAELVAAERESLRLLNQLRASLGLRLVSPSDSEMHAFARAWSLEMRNTGFRHSNPPRWFENIVWYSDENMTPAQAAAQFHDMWINSPGHYENMTNPDWSVTGIGMWHDETGWWGVHVFR